MPLETGTYIDSLNPSNPLGTGDPKAQGDDHFRLIKSTILNTFPNLTGEVAATQAELNRLEGVTGVTGTGDLVLSASPTFTGTVTAATVAATTLTGAGSGITALNASNLGSGTVPDARFPATLPALNGSALTNLNGSNIASGTVADGRLSSNVPLKNAAVTWTDTHIWTDSDAVVLGTGSDLALYHDGSNSVIRNITGALIFQHAGPAAAFEISAAGNFDFKDGTVTTAGASASEVGYAGVPQNDRGAGNYTAVLGDANKHIYMSAGSGGQTFTIPANASVAYPIGTTLTVVANNTGNVTVAITSDTLYLAGTGFGTTGSRTLAHGGIATAVKIGTSSWMISGVGLS